MIKRKREKRMMMTRKRRKIKRQREKAASIRKISRRKNIRKSKKNE